MSFTNPIGAYIFHKKVEDAGITYYISMNKSGGILIKKIVDDTDETQFAVTNDSLQTVIDNTAAYNYKNLSELGL